MQVLKFGGSSVADSKNIERVFSIVKDAVRKDKTILVSSAIGGCTDTLIEIGALASQGDKKYEELIAKLESRHYSIIEGLIPPDFQDGIRSKAGLLFEELKGICNGVYLIKELSSTSLDLIMSFGELLSTLIITGKFSSSGINCKWIDSREVIKTDYRNSQNIVDTKESYKLIKKTFEQNNCKLYILPGFIASDKNERTTTLGRGGSDYTASLLAVGVNARILEIWTDVNGMMTADPRIVPDARTIKHISYKEALELSHFGAKVVYPPTIQPVINKGIPIQVKNTFEPDNFGTLIERNPPESNEKIKGISGSNRIALLSMEGSGMVGIPGYSSRFFDILTKNEINIILITQASSVHTMLVAIDEKDSEKAKAAVDDLFAYEISISKLDPLKVEKGYSIISLVGDDMKNQSGAGGRMFEAIGNRGISIRAIAQGSSEKNVSAVVLTEDFNEAVCAIHHEFFGISQKQINLFIAGTGTVGSNLIEMIKKQHDYILKNSGVDIIIRGTANSKHYIIDKQQYNSDDSQGFIDKIISLSYINSIFVDCTSSLQISMQYQRILSEKIGIVTCNKIANSIDQQYYNEIHSIAARERVPFRYETNVGAALPIIYTIRQILNSGDKIQKIEASLSGSLSYIFNNYNASGCFANVVRDAQERGYTEPDPRTDLKGEDLIRKAIILAREIGLEVEAKDVKTPSFLPEESLKGSVEDFYKSLEANESHFRSLYNNTCNNSRKMCFCIEINSNSETEINLSPKVSVDMKFINSEHPFGSLKGTDNAIIIYTLFYPNGIKIEGAGAGGQQTASGLLNDILTL